MYIGRPKIVTVQPGNRLNQIGFGPDPHSLSQSLVLSKLLTFALRMRFSWFHSLLELNSTMQPSEGSSAAINPYSVALQSRQSDAKNFRIAPLAMQPTDTTDLTPVIAVLPNLTERYKPVFTRLAVATVSLRLAWYKHVTTTLLAPKSRARCF